MIDELLQSATESADGLADFGDDALFGGDGWRDGLRVLTKSLETEARLHELGTVVVRGELTKYLVNRLEVVNHHRQHPKIRDRDVTPPLIIVGQARTGTTMLFDLLAQDPDHRIPETWEVDKPLPPPRTATYDSDPRIAETEATFELVDTVAPTFRKGHQLGARLGQECIRITASAFTSPIFPTQYQVPTYFQWLKDDAVRDGHVAGSYTWHRRYLELLQSECPGPRWLLKSPGHAWTLPQLLDEYPNALLVQTHRDPAQVMASTTSLIATLRTLGTDDCTAQGIAAEFCDFILGGLERTRQARLDGSLAADHVVDVAFDELMANPIRVIENLYTAFGFDLTEPTRAAMASFLAEHRREPGRGITYTFDDTGLDITDIYARTAAYCSHFGVPQKTRTAESSNLCWYGSSGSRVWPHT